MTGTTWSGNSAVVKVGIGVDAHGFTEGEGLILGGVTVPYHKSIAGHSDGDILIHAIVDALLGATAQGDIGTHFPASDPQWKGADSRQFLQRVAVLLADAGVAINHIDCTIILQEPVIAPFIDDMRRNIAQDLNTDQGNVSIKATTTDYLGFTGRKEGIVAVAVATISQPNP